MEKTTEINVVDSIMGSGKTSWAIQTINEASESEKFVYITPYLKEVQRIIDNTDKGFVQPNNKNADGSKKRSLKELIVEGRNIVSTHSLFQSADDELIELLTGAGYTLILDEVMDVIDKANVTQRDILDLQALGHIEVNGNKVIWTCDDYDYKAKYSDVKRLAQSGNLFYHRGKIPYMGVSSASIPSFRGRVCNDVFIRCANSTVLLRPPRFYLPILLRSA